MATRRLLPYEYTSLSGPDEIRLVTILAGHGKDPVVVRIHHAQLPENNGPPKPTASDSRLEEANSTLPQGWEVFKTWEGRLLYVNQSLEVTTWNHPAQPSSDSIPELRDADPGVKINGDASVPRFEALSYTWGSPKSSKSVIVDISTKAKASEPRRLPVTRNLASALVHLRSRSEDRTIWIDAICINQADIAERSAQVLKMTLIYKLAWRVAVWFGPGSFQTRLAVSTLQFLADQIEMVGDMRMAMSPGAVEREYHKHAYDLPYDRKTWNAIRSFITKDWFFRVWIVQEICLANERAVVYCGDDSITWPDLRKVIVCFASKRNEPSKDFNAHAQAAYSIMLFEDDISYAVLMHLLAVRSCSDPRDMIYGMLGLVSEGLRRRIVPDYTRSFDEIYTQTTLQVIEYFGRLEVLWHCMLSEEPRITDAPTWVPDLFTMETGSSTALRGQFAAGLSCCEVQFKAPNILAVTGMNCGVVSDVKERIYDEDGMANEWEEVNGWKPENPDEPYVGGGTMMDAYARTFGGTYSWDRYPTLTGYATLEQWKEFLCGDNGADAASSEDDAGIGGTIFPGFEPRLSQRTMFSTDEEYIGIGPAEMVPGDIVTVLLGYDAPMALRPLDDGTYQIVGDCLIYGFQDSTRLLGPLRGGWKVQVFLNLSLAMGTYEFLNTETGVLTDEDPRLEPLVGWERERSERTADDPAVYQRFKRIGSDEVVNYDPRMSPDALRARGLSLTTFEIV